MKRETLKLIKKHLTNKAIIFHETKPKITFYLSDYQTRYLLEKEYGPVKKSQFSMKLFHLMNDLFDTIVIPYTKKQKESNETENQEVGK